MASSTAPTFALLLEAVPQPLDLGPVLPVEVALDVLQEPARKEKKRAEYRMPTGERKIDSNDTARRRRSQSVSELCGRLEAAKRAFKGPLPYESSGSSMFFSLAMISTWSPFTATSEASSSATVGN